MLGLAVKVGEGARDGGDPEELFPEGNVHTEKKREILHPTQHQKACVTGG